MATLSEARLVRRGASFILLLRLAGILRMLRSAFAQIDLEIGGFAREHGSSEV